MTVTSYPNYNCAFQRHRRRPNNLLFQDDLPELLDFSGSTSNHFTVSSRKHNSAYLGPVYELTTHPGFLYAPQALCRSLQQQLAFLALTEFCTWPHVTNLDPVLLNITPQTPSRHVPTCDSGGGPRIRIIPDKLSWAAMGYHYDWTNRQYTENSKSEIPTCIHVLSQLFFAFSTRVSSTFTTSAVLVNYYSLKSSMGGHQDDLEYDFSKPVISISLGLPAIFLLGQKKKEEGPVLAILVRPGDVLLLGGSSRLCFHGIARVLPLELVNSSLPPAVNHGNIYPHDVTDDSQVNRDELQSMTEEDKAMVNEFLSSHRININMRQVLPDGVESIAQWNANSAPPRPENEKVK